MVDHPCRVFSLKGGTTVGQFLVGLPFTKVEHFTEFSSNSAVCCWVFTTSTLHVVNVKTDDAAQLLRAQQVVRRSSITRAVLVVGLVEEKAARIQAVLAKSKGLQSPDCFQVPLTWCIQLAVDRLDELHPGFRRCAKDPQGLCRQLFPQFTLLRSSLQEGSLDVSSPHTPLKNGRGAQQKRSAQSGSCRGSRVEVAFQGVHIGIATHDKSYLCSWWSIWVLRPFQEHPWAQGSCRICFLCRLENPYTVLKERLQLLHLGLHEEVLLMYWQVSFTDVRLPFGKVLLLPSHLLGREVGIHSIFLSGRPIQLVNSYPSPGFLGVGVEVVAIVSQNFDLAVWKLLHGHPHRVQFVQRDWAISFIFGWM